MLNEELTIYSCANGRYQDFAPIYIASALWSNPGCHVEIGLETLEPFEGTPLGDAMASTFGKENYTLNEVRWTRPSGGNILPNSVRFVTEPTHKSRYVYIGDIDLPTLRPDICDIHVAHMQRIGLPFSNAVRPDTTRLTGLHFVEHEFQYPLPDISDLIETRISDEILLYNIVERKLGRTMPDFKFYRPVHGVHFSPNRAPWGREANGVKRPGWNIKPWERAWIEFRASDLYREIVPYVSSNMSLILDHLDLAIDDPKRSKQLWEDNPFILEGGRSNPKR